jgi:hypothetical protein
MIGVDGVRIAVQDGRDEAHSPSRRRHFAGRGVFKPDASALLAKGNDYYEKRMVAEAISSTNWRRRRTRSARCAPEMCEAYVQHAINRAPLREAVVARICPAISRRKSRPAIFCSRRARGKTRTAVREALALDAKIDAWW